MILKTKIYKNAIRVDPKVLSFAQNEIPNTLIVQELKAGKADYYYKKSREALNNYDIDSAYYNLILAIKFRNDIETITFKRYVSIKIKRQFNFNKAEITQNKIKINELNNTVKLISNKIKEVEIEKEKLISEKYYENSKNKN